eukprot:gene17716-biopygen5105
MKPTTTAVSESVTMLPIKRPVFSSCTISGLHDPKMLSAAEDYDGHTRSTTALATTTHSPTRAPAYDCHTRSASPLLLQLTRSTNSSATIIDSTITVSINNELMLRRGCSNQNRAGIEAEHPPRDMSSCGIDDRDMVWLAAPPLNSMRSSPAPSHLLLPPKIPSNYHGHPEAAGPPKWFKTQGRSRFSHVRHTTCRKQQRFICSSIPATLLLSAKDNLGEPPLGDPGSSAKATALFAIILLIPILKDPFVCSD